MATYVGFTNAPLGKIVPAPPKVGQIWPRGSKSSAG